MCTFEACSWRHVEARRRERWRQNVIVEVFEACDPRGNTGLQFLGLAWNDDKSTARLLTGHKLRDAPRIAWCFEQIIGFDPAG